MIENERRPAMLRWLLRRTVSAFERQWDYDASYLRDIIEASPQAAWRFFNAARLGSYSRDVPVAALVAAGLTAVRSEDCGPCTQLGATMAERRGVPPETLRAILTDDVAAMPDEVALAWRFTKAVLAHDQAADDYRAVILERWGPRAVVSLAFAITTARIYPTVKYAMGHGMACRRVVVGGGAVPIAPELTSRPLAALER
jgi:alkylhydroperoxidase family enzyme